MNLDLQIPDEDRMLALGRRLGVAAGEARGMAVYLHGELGAGKSTLARGWLAGMGHAGRVKSPTYTLLEPYSLPGGREVAHLDLYRLADPEELEFLGLRELSDPNHWLLIEWPEKGEGHLPTADIDIRIIFSPSGGRRLQIRGNTPPGVIWIQENAGYLLE